jgi:hypothetical protein
MRKVSGRVGSAETGSMASPEAPAGLRPSGYDPARVFTSREQAEIGAMLADQDHAQGPLCRVVGDWLVAKAMRMWPRLAGLRWFHKTNCKRRWILVSYHHPARLCWSWSVHVSLFQRFGGKGLSRLWSGYRYGQAYLRLPYVIEIGWHRQSYDWMLSSTAKQRLEAVAVFHPRREPEVSDREMTA